MDVIHRDDAGMFQLPGDLSFEEEPVSMTGTVQAVGPQLLEGHVSLNVRIASDPDLSDPTRRMQVLTFVSSG